MYATYKYARKKLRDRAQPQAGDVAGQPPSRGDDTAGILVGDDAPPRTSEAAKEEDGAAAAGNKKRKRKYRWKILFGLCAPFALQALDTTIIASALPFIAADFGEHLTYPTP